MTTRKKAPFDHSGSSFDSFLQEEGILEEVEVAAIKRVTVKAKTILIAEDADARKRQLDIAAQVDAKKGIRQGLEDAENGRLQPIREFFAEFEAEHGIKL